MRVDWNVIFRDGNHLFDIDVAAVSDRAGVGRGRSELAAERLAVEFRDRLATGLRDFVFRGRLAVDRASAGQDRRRGIIVDRFAVAREFGRGAHAEYLSTDRHASFTKFRRWHFHVEPTLFVAGGRDLCRVADRGNCGGEPVARETSIVEIADFRETC